MTVLSRMSKNSLHNAPLSRRVDTFALKFHRDNSVWKQVVKIAVTVSIDIWFNGMHDNILCIGTMTLQSRGTLSFCQNHLIGVFWWFYTRTICWHDSFTWNEKWSKLTSASQRRMTVSIALSISQLSNRMHASIGRATEIASKRNIFRLWLLAVGSN